MSDDRLPTIHARTTRHERRPGPWRFEFDFEFWKRRKRRNLVVGSSGYIGRHLVAALKADNQVVETCDVAGDADHRLDITRRDHVRTPKTFDRVYHLAAVSSPAAVAVDVDRSWQVNVEGTRHLAERFGARLVFAATYLRHATYYGLQKEAAEAIVRAAGGDVVRIANVFGGDGSRSVVDRFIDRARAGQPLELYNGGEQLVDLVHIDQAVDALCTRRDASTGVRLSIAEIAGLFPAADQVVQMVEDERTPFDARKMPANYPARVFTYVEESMR